MKTRVTINVDGSPRTVFSIKENSNNNDLNIHITSGGKTFNSESVTDLVQTRPEEEYIPADKYITVHNGTESLENNMIKRTINYGDGTQSTAVQLTGAIKSDNLFTPALFRICGDLSRDRYKPDTQPTDDEEISLGVYSPSTDQLRFMIVVSDKDKPFTPANEHPSNDLLLEFTNFSVTVIWSYLNQPSHPHAIDLFLTTTRETGPVAGLDWWQIYNAYTDLNMSVANEYFSVYGEGV
jgi:hypothetical protein